MVDFIKAAFPWIVMGLAIALFAANHVRQRKSNARKDDTDETEKKRDAENRMSEGMCIGMSLGVVFGTTGAVDLATGISLGMLLGMVVGMTLRK